MPRKKLRKAARYGLGRQELLGGHTELNGKPIHFKIKHSARSLPSDPAAIRAAADVCIQCGESGHFSDACPHAVCRYCKSAEHRTADCPECFCGYCGHRHIHDSQWCDIIIECRWCDEPGHHSTDCPYVECKQCGRPGHWKSECPDVRCFRCGTFGHIVRDCPDVICTTCGQRGHVSSLCKNTSRRGR